jgi:hypothetical protein
MVSINTIVRKVSVIAGSGFVQDAATSQELGQGSISGAIKKHLESQRRN